MSTSKRGTCVCVVAWLTGISVGIAAVPAPIVLTASPSSDVFTFLDQTPLSPGVYSVPGPRPERGVIARIDSEVIAAVLAKAPAQRFDQALRGYGKRIALPGPEGGMIECVIAESAVMEAALAERFPRMKTYIVQSLDGTMAGRLELTQRGMTAMLRVAPGLLDVEPAEGRIGLLARQAIKSRVWMIDPWQSGDASHAVSYWLHDLPGGTGDWVCETTPGVHGQGVVLPDEAEGEAANEVNDTGGVTSGVEETEAGSAVEGVGGVTMMSFCARSGWQWRVRVNTASITPRSRATRRTSRTRSPRL